MKVLHIGKYFPPYAGGMETYLRDLMASQARHGIGVAALVHDSGTSLKSQIEFYQSGQYSLPVIRAAVWARLLFVPISPTFPWLLNRLIKNHRPDILHLHMPNLSVFWALFLPSARRIPWVIQWQSDVVRSEHNLGLRAFYIFYHLFENVMLKRCKMIIVSSPPYLASSRTLQDFIDKCRVIPLGLDPVSLPAAVSHESKSESSSPLRVLAVGRLTYYKGFDYLIKAASQCRNIQLKIVGKGDMDTNLKKLASELSIENRVSFRGYLTEAQLAKEFACCDCVCLPSIERTESFGMVLLEAMYHGKATVVSKVHGSGMSWVVDDGVTGLHVPPKSIEGLKHALDELDMDRDKMIKMGMRGRKKFDRLFEIDKTAGKVSVIYNLTLGKVAKSTLRAVQ